MMKNGLKIYLIKKLLGTLNEKQKTEILTLAVAKLYNTISEKDIIREIGGKWFIGEREISSEVRKSLVAEAQYMLNMPLWKHLQDDVKYQANKMMFLESTSEIQLTAGKLWTFVLDIISTRLKSLSEGSGDFNNKFNKS